MDVTIDTTTEQKDTENSVLELIEQMQVPINSSCRGGVCMNCKSSCSDTSVFESMSDIEPLLPLDSNEFLPCVSRLKKDAPSIITIHVST